MAQGRHVTASGKEGVAVPAEAVRRGQPSERRLADRRLAQLRALRADLERDRSRLDTAYAELVEAMAAASERLLEGAREADFSPPPWPGGIGRTVEIRLSQTREITFRLGREGGSAEVSETNMVGTSPATQR